MGREQLIAQLEEVDNLPTLPVIVQQIQSLLASPRSSMAQIATVIARDQAISTKVVRLINSAFYGLGQPVSSIQQAIVLLGLTTVKNLVVGVSIVKTFDKAGTASLFDREKFWMHCFACAMGAKALAKRLGLEEPEDYFLAGLLHDIGVLILDQYAHHEFVDILQKAIRGKRDYSAVEKEVMGITHGEIGEILASKWKIPLFLSQSMRHHHVPLFQNPELSASLDKIAMVHIADYQAIVHGIGMGIACPASACSAEAMRRFSISQTMLDEVFAGIEKEVKVIMREWFAR